MSKGVQSLLEHYFAITDKFSIGPRQIQKVVKKNYFRTYLRNVSLTKKHLTNLRVNTG